MKRIMTIFIVMLLFASCSRMQVRQDDTYVIRYVDLARVYAYARKHDPESSGLNETEKKTLDLNKSRIFGRIKTAVSNTARRYNADFVFNTGEAILYSKTSYDITDDVIREYKKIIDISSPEIK